MKKAAGGARKYGRNRLKCERYRREHRREKHKITKWNKLIKKLSPENPFGEFYLLVIKEYLLESTNNFIKEENIKLKFTPINSELITHWRILHLTNYFFWWSTRRNL